MPPESRTLLEDMRKAADVIADFVTNKSRDDLVQDKLLRAGIYYEFVTCFRRSFGRNERSSCARSGQTNLMGATGRRNPSSLLGVKTLLRSGTHADPGIIFTG